MFAIVIPIWAHYNILCAAAYGAIGISRLRNGYAYGTILLFLCNEKFRSPCTTNIARVRTGSHLTEKYLIVHESGALAGCQSLRQLALSVGETE